MFLWQQEPRLSTATPDPMAKYLFDLPPPPFLHFQETHVLKIYFIKIKIYFRLHYQNFDSLLKSLTTSHINYTYAQIAREKGFRDFAPSTLPSIVGPDMR